MTAVVHVVDDDPSFLKAVSRLLQAGGYRVQTFSTAAAFLDRPASDAPGCVVLDLRLPGMDGFEVCRRIKSDPDTSASHIIAMTGYYEGDVAQRIVEMGASLLMQKPFTPDDLRRALAKVGVEVV